MSRLNRILIIFLFVHIVNMGQARAWEPESGMLSGNARIGVFIGMSKVPPTMFKFGHELDYSFNGPLHLSIGSDFAFRSGNFLFSLTPHFKYKFGGIKPAFVPYLKAGWEISLYSASNSVFMIGLGGIVGGGCNYMFLKNFGLGLDLTFHLGGMIAASNNANILHGHRFAGSMDIMVAAFFSY